MTEIQYQGVPIALPFRNRKGGLIGWGVVLIVLGALSGCLTLAIPLALATAGMAPSPRPANYIAGMIISIVLYGGTTAVLLTLGIGSVRCRRWVRPLVMILATAAIVAGVSALITIALLLPHLGDMAAGTPQQQVLIGGIIGLAILAVLLIALPAWMLVFYRSEDTRATLNYFDPQPRWTDRMPTHVLGWSLGVVLSALLLIPVHFQPGIAAFGTLISGPVAHVAVAAVWIGLLVSGWLCLRQRRVGWAISMTLVLVMMLSWLWTTAFADPEVYYRAVGLSGEELEATAAQLEFQRTPTAVVSAALTIATLVYGWWIRKFFTSDRPAA
jgi:MFS family permease